MQILTIILAVIVVLLAGFVVLTARGNTALRDWVVRRDTPAMPVPVLLCKHRSTPIFADRARYHHDVDRAWFMGRDTGGVA